MDGKDEWAVHIALVVDGQLQVGVVFAPSLQQCFLGVVGDSCYEVVVAADGRESREPVALLPEAPKVFLASDSARNQAAMAHAMAVLPEFERRAVHSVGIKALRILDGTGACYWSPHPLASWDFAAPAALLLAAGAVALNSSGTPSTANFPYGPCEGLFLAHPQVGELRPRLAAYTPT